MKIKTLFEFSGVPKGTTGIAEPDGNLWKVTWDLIKAADGNLRFKPLVDWFTEDEYKQYLERLYDK